MTRKWKFENRKSRKSKDVPCIKELTLLIRHNSVVDALFAL